MNKPECILTIYRHDHTHWELHITQIKRFLNKHLYGTEISATTKQYVYDLCRKLRREYNVVKIKRS